MAPWNDYQIVGKKNENTQHIFLARRRELKNTKIFFKGQERYMYTVYEGDWEKNMAASNAMEKMKGRKNQSQSKKTQNGEKWRDVAICVK